VFLLLRGARSEPVSLFQGGGPDDAFVARLPKELQGADLSAGFERFKLGYATRWACSNRCTPVHNNKPRVKNQIAPRELHWAPTSVTVLSQDIEK